MTRQNNKEQIYTNYYRKKWIQIYDSPEVPDRGETSEIPGLPSDHILFNADIAAEEKMGERRTLEQKCTTTVAHA